MDSPESDLDFDQLKLNIGRSVSAARTALGWTQLQLARKVGISRSQVGKIESFNITNINIYSLLAIARELGVPLFTIIMGPNDWKNICDNIMGREGAYSLIEAYSHTSNPDEILHLESMLKSEDSALKFDGSSISARISSEIIVSGLIRNSAEEQIPEIIGRTIRAASAIGSEMLPNNPVITSVIASILSLNATKRN
ncbi:transcriptional regulator with XRE-family HTH domain [Azospirillum lipoferum]|uniref:Helix-turn-helix transcriptional regulator n=1 Tax=Azospirillum lipoferum TaxID=193 RepID=A0A5A9GMR2_AZOLI|nr:MULTISPECIES: helix-turn-helix transcriptional regulator [Azospirillum]KAA0595730.1 helix-turn-helix transcriptional regulator [Azospirillum lipoferum]MCP1611402.1 transcriptional regulator with XRE-family HTH domain [Azospirillum lipoferum]MDW5537205.1 helix-turn-helix transcriptional regulator [Azospirillum sp. NL1]